jgi:hypothetical protein
MKKLVLAAGLLLAATSASLAQGIVVYGDGPEYGNGGYDYAPGYGAPGYSYGYDYGYGHHPRGGPGPRVGNGTGSGIGAVR